MNNGGNVKMPSSLVRVAFETIKDSMGEGSFRLLLKRSNLERYIGNLPPYDDSPSITTEEYNGIVRSVFEVFGEKAAKPILYICGKVGFEHSIKDSPALFGLAGIGLKLMSDEKKKKAILSKILKKSEEMFETTYLLDEDENNLYIKTAGCIYCEGITSTTPICYTPLGFYEAALKWATGKPEKVVQIQCRAMGHENCTFQVSK
ncbi:MAG: hypothetical protein GYA51_15225 [Candidatus Methanofastidiosa archaeon]|jgi:predicted hydrocarbon binding protein|nr:hypothetical protein [Candidatus Methanofastidiosa archaeon]